MPPASTALSDARTGAPSALPESIRTEVELDDFLTRPTPAVVEATRTLTSPLVILGAGGKMGPTLAVLAHRAAEAARHRLEVIAVSRFSNPEARQWLEQHGVKTVSCDLMEPDCVNHLPPSANVIHLLGMKFGTQKNPSATWALNTLAPARMAEFYPHARMVALSTGNVYPLSPVARGGSVETDPLTPLGEYANAAVGRERILGYCSHRHGTPMAVLRLFYATELRYGVLADIARKVWAGEPLSLANGFFNCIWQGDANALILRALSTTATPPAVFNLCRPETFSVRETTLRLGELLGRAPQFTGTETDTALLGNAAKICGALGTPGVPLDAMLRWTADWVKSGGRSLERPTSFEIRDGSY